TAKARATPCSRSRPTRASSFSTTRCTKSCCGRGPAIASSSGSRRPTRTSGYRSATRALRSQPRRRAEGKAVRAEEQRESGHVPPPPRPQTGFARGRLSPGGGRTFFASEKTADLLGISHILATLRYRTKRENDPSIRGKSVEFDHALFERTCVLY